jgi:SET domain-containing protein
VLITFGPSSIHGTGAFASADILLGSWIIEYVGEKISKEESLERCQANNGCIFYLDSEHDLDGNVERNAARFINHSCAPNCTVELIAGQLWVVAARDIKGGEEITFNYGYDLVEFREHPCHCGAVGCVGYILAEEFHGAVGPCEGR